jgi:hypothetical protein
MEPLKVPPQRTGDVNRKRCRMHSRPAEHVLIESQEEVRSQISDRGSSLRSDQIDNPGWIRKWVVNPARIDRKKTAMGHESSFSLTRQAQTNRYDRRTHRKHRQREDRHKDKDARRILHVLCVFVDPIQPFVLCVLVWP